MVLSLAVSLIILNFVYFSAANFDLFNNASKIFMILVLAQSVETALWIILSILLITTVGLIFWIRKLQHQIYSQKILNQFATSLYNKTTIEDVFWNVAQNCIHLLKLEDCVVYLLVEDRNVLIQKSAAGPKSKERYYIINPIEIPVGSGIVGTVAKTGKAEIIPDTSKDPRYIVDDKIRFSEIAVPILIDDKIFGVIDSENEKRNFYTSWHLHMLLEVAKLCGAKFGRYFAEEQIRSKVARDLHDDMGSTLSSIKIMSNIALENHEAKSTNRYLKIIGENAALMQESMSDIVWAINPDNDTMDKIVLKMKEFAAEILEPLNIRYEFKEEGCYRKSYFNLSTRKDFYLIFKEAINNIAKYSACSTVLIHMISHQNQIELYINDNGKGFDVNACTSGNGLKNMNYRAKCLKATLSIRSTYGKGTFIHLSMPSHDQGI